MSTAGEPRTRQRLLPHTGLLMSAKQGAPTRPDCLTCRNCCRAVSGPASCASQRKAQMLSSVSLGFTATSSRNCTACAAWHGRRAGGRLRAKAAAGWKWRVVPPRTAAHSREQEAAPLSACRLLLSTRRLPERPDAGQHPPAARPLRTAAGSTVTGPAARGTAGSLAGPPARHQSQPQSPPRRSAQRGRAGGQGTRRGGVGWGGGMQLGACTSRIVRSSAGTRFPRATRGCCSRRSAGCLVNSSIRACSCNQRMPPPVQSSKRADSRLSAQQQPVHGACQTCRNLFMPLRTRALGSAAAAAAMAAAPLTASSPPASARPPPAPARSARLQRSRVHEQQRVTCLPTFLGPHPEQPADTAASVVHTCPPSRRLEHRLVEIGSQ